MAYLVAALEVVVEAQKGVHGIRPEIMHPAWHGSRLRILVGGPSRQRTELRSHEESHDALLDAPREVTVDG